MQINAEHNIEAELRREVRTTARRVDSCARAVVVALIFEALVLWEYAGNKPLRETVLFIACDLLLAIAIYGEITFGNKLSAAQAGLQRLSDQKVAESNERAAEATRKAEEARLELAKYREARVLNAEQIDRITAELREFSGVRFALGLAFMDPEFFILLLLIEAMLEKAGWIATDWRTGPTLTRQGKPAIGTAVSAYGVIIGIPLTVPVPAENPPIVHAGAAVISALQAEGIETTSTYLQPEPSIIHIMIGRKP